MLNCFFHRNLSGVFIISNMNDGIITLSFESEVAIIRGVILIVNHTRASNSFQSVFDRFLPTQETASTTLIEYLLNLDL